jgi:hypothetical protein
MRRQISRKKAFTMTQDIEPKWEYVPDGVMGGVSRGQISKEAVLGHQATRLTGEVSLDNNGGFLQMAFDFAPGGGPVDASGWSGIEMDVCGNAESYDFRLRTTDLSKPWQSYRAAFTAPQAWTSLRFAFDTLERHRTDAPFDPKAVRRLGLVAVGRVFTVDIAVRNVRFF